MSTFKIGDPVIYSMQKVSTRPSLRAKNVEPAAKGETYTYEVDKFWVVVEVLSETVLLVQTRRGKQLRLATSDSHLRRASWFERLWYRSRFPRLSAPRTEMKAMQLGH